MKIKFLIAAALFALPSCRALAASGPSGEQLRGLAPDAANFSAGEPGLAPAAAPARGAAGNTAAEIAARCSPAAEGEPVIRQEDYRWNYTLPELLARFGEMYASPKRLASRAYWDKATGTLRLPYMKERGGDIVIDPAFVQAVQRHIERAFELKYADAVFFPDMGHSHFLVPDQLWKTKYDLYPLDRMTDMQRDMFRDPRVKIFYHTAEQLKTRGEDGQLVPDERTQFRYQTRNISGFISANTDLAVHQNPASSANTVSEVPGHYWWGSGFNVSAQKDGCFVYRAGGKTYRFDLSMFDLPADPVADYKAKAGSKAPAPLE